MTTTRALTIRQPWAFAIAEGFKTIENRTRRTNYRGPVLIHAGLSHDDTVSIARYRRDAAARLDQLGGRGNLWDARGYIPSRICSPPPASLAMGAIIATAEIDGSHTADDCCGPWAFHGCWHWTLANVVPLSTPVATNGRLGLWKPSPELLAAVHEQLPTTTRRIHQPGDTGRCQHCQQPRPLYPWSPAPLPWEELPGGWLCARDYSAAKLADDNGRGKEFRLDHELIVWPEDKPTVQVYVDTAAVSGSVAARAQDGAQP